MGRMTLSQLVAMLSLTFGGSVLAENPDAPPGQKNSARKNIYNAKIQHPTSLSKIGTCEKHKHMSNNKRH